MNKYDLPEPIQKITLESEWKIVTIENKNIDDITFAAWFELVKEACLALGYSPNTVSEYFDYCPKCGAETND